MERYRLRLVIVTKAGGIQKILPSNTQGTAHGSCFRHALQAAKATHFLALFAEDGVSSACGLSEYFMLETAAAYLMIVEE